MRKTHIQDPKLTFRHNKSVSRPFDLASPYALGNRTREEFESNGYVKLSQVLQPAVLENCEPEITAKVIELNTQHLPLAERDTYGKAFLQVCNLWEHSPAARELVFSRRLAGIAAALLDVPSTRLYHDQALYKEPGGGVTPWHADQYYWPFGSDRAVTAWIPLQATPLDMGPLAFAPGSHRFQYGRDLPISDESERRLQMALKEQNFGLDESAYVLGDVSFHLGWTFHRASPNRASTPRRVLTIIYIDAEMVVAEPTNLNQHEDLERWLPGLSAGGVAATGLNPVLYE